MDPLFAALSYSNITSTHLSYLANVTSDLQTQLDNTASAITGAASTITTSNLTASRALVSDASGKVAASSVPSANLEFVTNLTSDAQTQLDAKAALSGSTFTGDVAVQGNLTISGTTTTINTQQLTVADPVVVVNSGSLNQPSGVYIHQASGPNVAVLVQNSAVEFVSTTANANAASFTGDFMPLRAGNVFASSVTLGNSTLGETANIFQLQKSGAMANSSAGESVVGVYPASYTQSTVYVSGVPRNEAATETGMQNGFSLEPYQTGTTNAGPTEFIQMDLGAPRQLSQIVIGTAQGSPVALFGGWGVNYAANKSIEVSNNATNWTIVGNTGPVTDYPFQNMNYNSANITVTRNITPGSYRYVRIAASTTSTYIALTEFKAYEGTFVKPMVAVGSGTNVLAYSADDGVTWIGLGSSGSSIFTNSGRGVARNGPQLVAVGAGTNTIAHSSNGTEWVGLGTSVFSDVGYGVACSGSRWVAVGSGTNSIAYSTHENGIVWTGVTGKSIFSNWGLGVAWNGSLWVAVGEGTNSIATSPDGINWTARADTSMFSVGRGVAWNGSLWVAVGEGTNSIATSPDGINWTGRTGTSIFSSGYGVAWNGSVWVAVGFGGTNSIATSPDGINWTGRTGKSIFSSQGYGVAWNGVRFVATGQGTNAIAYSTDGIDWTGITAFLPVFTSQGFAVA